MIEEKVLQIKGKHPLRSKGDVSVAEHFRTHFYPHLIRYAGSFYTWKGSHYAIMDEERLPADIARAYHAFPVKGKDDKTLWDLKTKDINAIHAALKARCHLDANERLSLPCWLDMDDAPFLAAECVAFNNGILHVPSREFIPPTPNLFAVAALPHPYDPHAGEPVEWLKWLESILDQPSIDLLQEWFGYCITNDNSMHKLMWMVGPPRSGKGTIMRILEAIVGSNNVAAPTFHEMTNSFGLQGLINKTNAIVGDARFDAKKDKITEILNNILRITGGDKTSVAQKYKIDWQGTLCVRFTVGSNEAPPRDNVNALDSRLLFLQFTQSFVGREDRGLEGRLKTELTEITNWALNGLERLRVNGRFTDNNEETRQIWELVHTNKSPLAEWLGAFFDVTGSEDDRTATRKERFEDYKFWLNQRGLNEGAECSNLQKFSTALVRMTSGQVRTDRHDGANAYLGMRVRDASTYASAHKQTNTQAPNSTPKNAQASMTDEWREVPF